MIGEAELSARIQNAPQEILAREQGNFAQIESIAIKQVEQKISHRITHKQVRRGTLYVHALLHALEFAASSFIENDDFAIQNRLLDVQVLRQGSQFGILVRNFIAGARSQ